MSTLSMPVRRVSLITLILSLVAMTSSFATTYYSRTNGGFWNVASTWSTVTYGNATNTGTFPKSGDDVFIGDHYHIWMNMNAFCKNITIGQGVSGSLEYAASATYTMTISGNVRINGGGRLFYAGASARTHLLYIGGDLVNNGDFDLYASATALVNLYFSNKSNSVISGSGTFDMNKVTLFKSLSTAYYMDVQVINFENAIRQLVVSYGTYIHNNLGTYNVNPALLFTLYTNGIIQVPQGEMDFSSTVDYMYLEGALLVNGGIVKVGSAAGLKGLRYTKNGTVVPSVTVSAGTLQVYGGITYKAGTSNLPFIYSQTNGTVLLNNGTTGTNTEVFKVTDVAASSFNMSGGIMILGNPSTGGSAIADFAICGSQGIVSCSAGVVQFGDGATASGKVFNFLPFPNVVQPSFMVTGPAGNVVTLKTSTASTVNFQLLSLYIDVNKVFDIRSVSGTAGDTKQMTLTHEFDGINALINDGTFTARQGTVLLQAPEGQWIGGSMVTGFYNLSINNSFGISLGQNVTVTKSLILTNGIVYSNSAAMITCTNTGAANIGSSISYIDGPMAQVVATIAAKNLNLPVGKNGDYRPMILAIQHNSIASVTYTAECWNSSARAMGYTLPASLTWVSDIRYYSIDRTPVANVQKAKLTLSYGPDDIVTDYNNLRVASYNGAGAWLNINGVGTANNAGNITSTNFTSFNRLFTLGNANGGTNPLPVELVSFTAQKANKMASLKWTTATEKNSDYFAVERSNDGLHFSEIGKVKSAGNSTTVLNYSFIDADPAGGLNYYRLRQVDFDGTVSFSPVRNINSNSNTIGHVTMYPNPVSKASDLSITLPDQISGNYLIHLIDVTGRVISTQKGSSSSSEMILLNAGNALTAGSYLVRITDDNNGIWQDHLIINP